jgi:HJR/Mrr/RecB family endonuclease
MKTMDRRKFEELVAELFYGMGYEVELTQQTRDGGKDIIALANFGETRNKYLIECKRPDPGNAVSVGVVRALMGVKCSEKATKAIAVTTTHFSSDAHAFKDNNIWELDLKEFDDLVKWLDHYKSTRL